MDNCVVRFFCASSGKHCGCDKWEPGAQSRGKICLYYNDTRGWCCNPEAQRRAVVQDDL